MSTPRSQVADRARVAELLAKYDRPGPRYTSYPTAVEFNDELTADVYAEKLSLADQLGDEPLSVYMHLPFCEERCLFCGCHVIISPDKTKATPYVDMIEAEIDMIAGRLPNRRKVSQLHLGGGTPTYQSPAQLDRLMKRFFSHFEAAPGAELAVEVDPRVTSAEHIDVLADHGFNRISLGVQDFTHIVQESINRVQSVEQTAAIIDHARSKGFGGVNVDLIYGLPHQTPDTFEKTVETVIALGADRSAVYSFAFVPWIRGHQRKLMEDNLPSPATKFELFGLVRECFLGAGYEPIGMDHFAKPGDELSLAKARGDLRRNFQGYAVIPADDVIALGISGIGDLQGAYVQNLKKLSTYRDAVAAGELPIEKGLLLTEDDKLRRVVIHQFMCNFRIDRRAIEAQFGLAFEATFAEDLRRLEGYAESGLVTIDDDAIQATPEGELFIRNLAMCFDVHWREKHEGKGKNLFSKTV
ncbi:MAG: oxygen-independent coproporphyrinogen III oxidase [Planctomycetota bacterium]|nr:oxygen-independent coproporphyrinogen III oxidase [Planctomycetota bacterium]